MWNALTSLSRHAINQVTRSTKRRSRPRLAYERLERRQLLAGDVLVRYEFTDLNDRVLSTLAVNQEFRLNAYVSDQRAAATGISQAYFDVSYPSSLASVSAAAEPGPDYDANVSGTVSTAGLLDEIGGADGDSVAPVPPDDELLLFSVPMRANAPGTLVLTSSAADGANNDVRLFGSAASVPLSSIDFGGGTIQIVSVGVTISPSSGLQTTEAGGTATFSAVLTTAPTQNVSFTLSSSNTAEGTVSPAAITFSPENWNIPQTVTVTGADDSATDGNVTFNIVTSATTSTDPSFNNLPVADVTLTNLDNENSSVGVTVAPTSGLMTTEAGGTSSFIVVLTSAPESDVTISIVSSDLSEATVSVERVVFTSANWNTPQTVLVTGVDDNIDDADVAYLIVTGNTVSADARYNNLEVPDVSAVNVDNDIAGVQITPLFGLITSEAGGTATFTVRLASQPTQDVSIALVSSDSTEGTVSTPSLIFTAANWSTPQTVTVTGVDDDIVDGNLSYTINTGATVSTDTAYNSLEVPDVAVLNNDNDQAGITVTPVNGLVTNESGLTADFSIRLNSQPTADVIITLTSSDTTEGTLAISSVTFTPQNWNTAQTVTVTGVNDVVADGDIAYTIVTAPATSTDPAYSGLNAPDVQIVNQDDDAVGVRIEPISGLRVTEAGTVASFTMVLTSQPSADVTINLTSSDLSEGTLDKSDVVFTPLNWNLPQTVSVTGVDDLLDDGDINFSVVTSAIISNDIAYSGRVVADVAVTNEDNDEPGVTILPTTGLITTEAGQTASFQVVLTSPPTTDVVINLSSSDPSEGTLSVPSLTFTTGNWNVPQTVLVQGVDDSVVDGDKAYWIVTTVQTSDPFFTTINPADVAVTNSDNDTAFLAVTSIVQAEGNGSGTTAFEFTVELTSTTESGFTVDYATFDGTASAAGGDYANTVGVLSFSGSNGEQRRFTVLVNRDDIVEADETFEVRLANVAGIPTALAQRIVLPTAASIGTIRNDDTATVTITPPLATQEGTGTSDTLFVYQVSLVGAVQGGFSIAYRTDDGTARVADNDYVDNDGTLRFLGTANELQTVTLRVRADNRVEPDETLAVVLGGLTDLPSAIRDAITVVTTPTVATILNDDVARLTFREVTASSREGTGSGITEFRYEVTLSDTVADADGFDVPFATANGTATVVDGDYEATTGSLRFVGTAGESQFITVRINRDAIVEANETFLVRLGNPLGLQTPDAVLIPVRELESTIENDDVATLRLSTTAVTREEGSLFSFTVTLSNAIQQPFSVSYSTTDGTAAVADQDYTASTGTLNFTGAANEALSFTVSTRQDAKVERDETFSAVLNSLLGLNPSIASSVFLDTPLIVTVRNDDTATITLTPPVPQREGTGPGTTDFVFQVTVSAPVDGGFSLPYETVDGTAISVEDYNVVGSSLTGLGASAETRQVIVRVNADSTLEPNESFQLKLATPAGLLAGLEPSVTVVNDTATALIQNDDDASLTISQPVALNEGTGDGVTAFEYTVRLEGNVPGRFQLSYRTNDGTATFADNDYVDNDGTLLFNGLDGETRVIRVLVNRDARVERDESFEVVLGQVTGLEPEIAELLVVDRRPVSGTIRNDDSATIAFDAISSKVLETSVHHAVSVRLRIEGGGSLTEPATVFMTLPIGSSASPNDFQLRTTSITFPAGSMDGASQLIDLRVTADDLDEPAETVILGLELASGTQSTVSLGSANRHTVTIVDDTIDGVLSGRVWIDANQNGVQEVGELTLPGVTIRLTGNTKLGEIISRQTVTDGSGFYQFINLAAGTYSIEQIQPPGYLDGQDLLGRINGVPTGTLVNDRVIGITMRPGQQGVGFDFGEAGLQPESVFSLRPLSRPRSLANFGSSVVAQPPSDPLNAIADELALLLAR